MSSFPKFVLPVLNTVTVVSVLKLTDLEYSNAQFSLSQLCLLLALAGDVGTLSTAALDYS